MFNLNHTPGRTAIVDGKEYLFFSGYSYLGMNHVPEFIELVKEGIDKYGLLFPSSRISNTRLNLLEEFEAKLSSINGMEETVCFSSGFLAGRAVVDLFKREDYSCAPLTHPAINFERTQNGGDKITLREPQGDITFDSWLKQPTSEKSILVFDSVNPLTAEVNDVSFLDAINNKLTCIIDDSHGTGLINNGKGVAGSLSKKHDNIITFSLSKAYNLVGGAVSCSKEIAEQLRASPFYTASTSISPAFAFAFLKGQDLYKQQREKLKKNIETFRTLTNDQLKSHGELPIFILPVEVNENILEEAGIIISSFAYPDPAGESIKRVVLNALHTESDLQVLASALK
jgi:8-amino-7-oxononanoate synthase